MKHDHSHTAYGSIWPDARALSAYACVRATLRPTAHVSTQNEVHTRARLAWTPLARPATATHYRARAVLVGGEDERSR
eukprot:scaffold23310_cov108-Isochrysis_galbana.AAC.1